MDKITVCILAYNAEKYLQETLDSLENQDCNFRYLLINDGSTDGTQKICDSFSKTARREVEIHAFMENHGTAYCRNWALYHIDTELMMFFDADDIAKPELVSCLQKELESDSNYIAVSCYSKYIDENGKILGGGAKHWSQNSRRICISC